MAEIEVKGGKKSAPRIDLTPMVDLGFLLITFFMFTTTMTRPKAMDIQMPYKDKNMPKEDQSEIKNSVALTILLSKDHRLYYYEGIGDDPNSPPDVKLTYFKNNGGIRDIIIDKENKVRAMQNQGLLGPKDKTTVLIKPDSNCTTKDLIGILDEMTINAVPVYAVVDITPEDQAYIKKTEVANGEK